MTAKQAAKKLDKEIEQFFYKHGSGVQIPIMDLSKIHKAGQSAAAANTSIEQAVVEAIAKYRVN